MTPAVLRYGVLVSQVVTSSTVQIAGPEVAMLDLQSKTKRIVKEKMDQRMMMSGIR